MLIFRPLRIFLLFSVLLSGSFCGSACAKDRATARPSVHEGVLDLRGWDFKRDGAVTLRGNWAFHRNKLLAGVNDKSIVPNGFVRVPLSWNNQEISGTPLKPIGAHTYSVRILLPPGLRAPTLYMRDQKSAHRVFANGKLIAVNGIVGKSAETTRPFYRPQVVELPPEARQPDSGGSSVGDGQGFAFRTVILSIQVANFHDRNGGLFFPIRLGPEPEIRRLRENSLMLDIFILGTLCIFGLYHLGLFAMRPAEKATLFFGLICLIIALRMLLTGERYLMQLLPGGPFEILYRLEFFTFFAGVPLFATFVGYVFPGQFPRRVLRVIQIVCLMFCFSLLFLPITRLTHTAVIYQVVTLVCGVYVIAVAVFALFAGADGSRLFLLGWGVLFLSILNDILRSHEVVQTPLLAPAGLFFFVFAQSSLLALRFHGAFRELDRVSRQLRRALVKKRHVDELRMERDAAERASRTKSEFLANMSHEIRTPMNAILGMADLLAGEPEPEERMRFVRIIRRSGETLLTLLGDILDLARVEAGRLSIEHLNFDLHDTLRTTLDMMETQAAEKGLILSLKIEDRVPRWAAGDAARLRQVLVNLIGNGVKFTEKGSVSLHVDCLKPKLDPSGPAQTILQFNVSDTGRGIAAEQLGSIFDTFTQEDNSTTRKYGGSGLGLTICRRLVELMGGEINVASQPGVGSSFTFWIPFHAGTASEPATKGKRAAHVKSPPATLPPLKILFAEDQPDNRALVFAFLKKFDLTLDVAEDGAVAVEKYRAGDHDLVLMDMQMPKVDGFSATEQIRRIEQAQGRDRVPIIALTAHAMPEEIKRMLAAGCDAHLAKPLQKALLIRALADFAVETQSHEHE